MNIEREVVILHDMIHTLEDIKKHVSNVAQYHIIKWMNQALTTIVINYLENINVEEGNLHKLGEVDPETLEI